MGVMKMKAVDAALVNRVERNEMLRALHAHEAAAAALRSDLGFVQREVFENITPDHLPPDGVTRMRTDQIDRLFESGKINGDQRAAALKFRTIWEAISRGLFASSSSGGGGTRGSGTYRHPLERMSETELAIWFLEYKPWANGPAAKTAISRGGFKISFLQLCYNVIIDNFGPSQLEAKWPISRGNSVVVKALRHALGSWQHVECEDYDSLLAMRSQIMKDDRNKIKLAHQAIRAT